MAQRILHRYDTKANWAKYNPVLGAGEHGYESDTEQWKCGNGVTAWNSLPYRGLPCVQQKGQSQVEAPSQKLFTDEVARIDGSLVQLEQNHIYALGQNGINASVISKAITYIKIATTKDITKKYYLTVVRRNDAGGSQISLYTTNLDGSNQSELARWSYNGDPNNNSIQTINFGTNIRVKLSINWASIPDGTKFTNMFEGYELSDNCFDASVFQIDDELRRLQFPYSNTSTGSEIFILRDVFIDLKIPRAVGFEYYIGSVVKSTGAINVHKKEISSGAISTYYLVRETDTTGIKAYFNYDGFKILIDWDKIPNNYNKTNMVFGYELSNDVFSVDDISVKTASTPIFTGAPDVNVGFFDFDEKVFKPTNGWKTYEYKGAIKGQNVTVRTSFYGSAKIFYKNLNEEFKLLVDSPSAGIKTISFVVPEDAILLSIPCFQSDEYRYMSDISVDVISNYFKKIFTPDKQDNIIVDPSFSFGEKGMSISEPEFLFKGSNFNVSSISNGNLEASSKQSTAKGLQIGVNFADDWVSRFDLKGGDAITIGCDVMFEYQDDATVINWGMFYDNSKGESAITYTPKSMLLPVSESPKGVFKTISRTITLKKDFQIGQETFLSLVYLQILDPQAASKPTKITIKNPCIIFNSSEIEYKYQASKRSVINELLKSKDLMSDRLDVKDVDFRANIEAEFTNVNTLNLTARWLKFDDNFDFPSTGIYIGLRDDKLVKCINGVVTVIG